MSKRIKQGLVAVAATTLVIGVGAAAFGTPSDADHKIRKTDFTASDTRPDGAIGFTDSGSVVIRTQSNTTNDKVAEYFDLPLDGLPNSASLDYMGTGTAPGVQVVFDTDGDATNANSYNVLVGEAIYGNDFWMTGGKTRADRAASPAPRPAAASAPTATAPWRSGTRTCPTPRRSRPGSRSARESRATASSTRSR